MNEKQLNTLLDTRDALEDMASVVGSSLLTAVDEINSFIQLADMEDGLLERVYNSR